MTNITKKLSTIVLVIAATSLFSFSAVAEEPAVTQIQAQQVRIATVNFEQNLALMLNSISAENEDDVVEIAQTNLQQMNLNAIENFDTQKGSEERIAE